MARPIKYGLDYWNCDVDIFDDDKVIPVTGEFGIKGQIVLVHLLCAIYRNGYFILWTERLRYSLCSKMPGISDEVLCMIVNRLVKWGFFDENLFSSVKVLTSKAIQKRYFSAVYRRKIIETDEFLLLPLPEGFCCQKQQEKSDEWGFCQHIDNNNTPAGGFLLSKTPKVNKSKVKEKKEISPDGDTKKAPEGNSLLPTEHIPYRKICDMWNETADKVPGMPKVAKLTDERKRKIAQRIREMDGKDIGKAMETYASVLDKIPQSSFFTEKWQPDFDWLFVNGSNWVKILEGNYAKTGAPKNVTPSLGQARPQKTAREQQDETERIVADMIRERYANKH